MDLMEAYKGVNIALIDIDVGLIELLGIDTTELEIAVNHGDRYLNVYRTHHGVINWITFNERASDTPLVTTTEEIKQFIFDVELST